MVKAYKAEFTLGIIGAILGINAIFFLLIGLGETASWGYRNGGMVASLLFGMLMSVSSFILGFIAVAKLNKNNKSGGTLLVISGILGFLSLFLGGIPMGLSSEYSASVVALVYFILHALPATALMLTGGIMALARKRQIPQTPPFAAKPPYPPNPYYAAYPPPYPPSPSGAPYAPHPPYAPYPPPAQPPFVQTPPVQNSEQTKQDQLPKE